MATNKRSHLGQSGVHAVRAELNLRGWNSATPDVDVGEDLLAIDDRQKRVVWLQVKTTEAAAGRDRIQAKFGGIGRDQLWSPDEVAFYYVFVVRVAGRWDFVVVSRRELRRLRTDVEDETVQRAPAKRPGPRPRPSPSGGDEAASDITLVLTFTRDDVTLWGRSLQAFRNNWTGFPEINAGPGATATPRDPTRAP